MDRKRGPPDEPDGHDTFKKLKTQGLATVEPAILTPEQADQSCVEFTHQTLLSKLNQLSGLDLPMEYKGVRSGIEHLIFERHDIGTAYAWFRTACQSTRPFAFPEDSWFRGGLPDLSEYGPHLMEAACDDRDIVRSWAASELGRAASLPATEKTAPALPPTPGIYVTEDGATVIMHPELIPPRRLWDLRSNRIVPYDWQCYFVQSPSEPGSTKHTPFAAISHSWTDDMSPVSTSINKGQWGVPLPRGVTIEKLRQELLQLRETEAYSVPIEYCWLDVLCLRQASDDPQLEEIKTREWKIDVPTIGNAYRQADLVARYMNGLGISFRVDGWDSEHHWSKRVWTLQEVAYSSHAEAHKKKNITMGLPAGQEDSILVMVGTEFKIAAEILNTSVQGKITSWSDLKRRISEVDSRCCSNESDKIAALSSLIRLNPMPVFNAKDKIETAWARCCEYLSGPIRLEMLFQHEQGFPTWASLTAKPLRGSGAEIKPLLSKCEKPWVVLAHNHDGCYRGPWEFLGGRIKTVVRSRDPADGLYTWHSKLLTHLWVGQVRVERRSESNLYSVTSVDEISTGGKKMDFCMRNCDRASVIHDGCYTLLALHQETYGYRDMSQFAICKVLLEDEIIISRNWEPSKDSIFGTIIHMRKMAVLRTATDEDTKKVSAPGLSFNKTWESWKQEQKVADGSWRLLRMAGQPHSVKYYIYL